MRCVLSLLKHLHPISDTIDWYVRHWVPCSGVQVHEAILSHEMSPPRGNYTAKQHQGAKLTGKHAIARKC